MWLPDDVWGGTPVQPIVPPRPQDIWMLAVEWHKDVTHMFGDVIMTKLHGYDYQTILAVRSQSQTNVCHEKIIYQRQCHTQDYRSRNLDILTRFSFLGWDLWGWFFLLTMAPGSSVIARTSPLLPTEYYSNGNICHSPVAMHLHLKKRTWIGNIF